MIELGYQAVFDAIAAATRIEGGAIAISVRRFRESLAQAGDTRSAETENTGSARKGEHAVPKGCAQ